MEKTELEKPVGTDFLEEIYRKNEQTDRLRTEQTSNDEAQNSP